MATTVLVSTVLADVGNMFTVPLLLLMRLTVIARGSLCASFPCPCIFVISMGWRRSCEYGVSRCW